MNPALVKLVQKAGIPAGLFLLKVVGLEGVTKQIEGSIDRIAERQKAIAKARSLRDGRFAAVVVEDRTRYVVYVGDEPRAIFPSTEGDLGAEMRDFDKTRLKDPADLNTARSRTWTAERLRSLRDRLPGRSHSAVDRAEPMDTSAADGAFARVEKNVGEKAFEAIIASMPDLLTELTRRQAAPFQDTDALPSKPGVYLFSEGPSPCYVGNTPNLRQRLREHTGASSRENQAALAWRMALQQAEEAGVSTSGTRKTIEADPAFAAIFEKARERVAKMDVRFIEVDDPIVRTVLEVYVARALGTDSYDSLETH